MSETSTPTLTSRGLAPGQPAAGGPTVPADLHATVPELVSRMLVAADRDDWLNVYLYAAGTVQVVEDQLQGTARLSRRLLDHVGGDQAGPGTRALLRSAMLRSARLGLDATTALTYMTPAGRWLRRWGEDLAALTDRLADLVLSSRHHARHAFSPRDAAERSTAALLRRDLHVAAVGLRMRPGAVRLLDGALLRHPSCFASFDQHPDDTLELARRFATRQPRRDRPLVVVGIRTSGSYLAPLAGAALRRLGYSDVVVGTTRPGAALLPGRGAAVGHARAHDGFVLILDDPPTTGGSLASVARRAEEEGFPAESVVPLVATFDDTGAPPPKLERYPGVLLPARSWHVRRQLRAEALEPLVSAGLPGGARLVRITVGDQGELSRRAHLTVPVTADIEDDGGPRTILMEAEWTGVGYFGERAVTTAIALGGLVPTVYAFGNGVLLRERLSREEHEETTVGTDDVVLYAVSRQKALALPEDRSRHLAGRQPVWEVAARILAPAFGRLGTALRPPLVEPLTRSILAAEHPCVIDGRATLERWMADSQGAWVKTDYAEGAFSHLDLADYDAAFDLARAVMSAADSPEASVDEGGLLAEYCDLSGSTVSPARWCLLKLVHAWDQERLGVGGSGAARRAKARAVQRFLAETYLGRPDVDVQGDWCVLDIDGVLETDVLGFSASSPQGMLALRALRAHGYRVLLATGRPLQDLEDRCAAYGLSGGVAEYGCVSYDAASGDVHVHVPSGSRDPGSEILVRRLSAEPEVSLDPLYRWAVRASVGEGTRRTALPQEMVRDLLDDRAIHDAFYVVQGDAQTDFVPRGADKVRGVRGLFGRIGEAGAVPVLAVGDGVADVRMTRWAERGLAPRNAEPAVAAAGVPVLDRAYQAGLAEAVGRLIGHRPGGCPSCAAPHLDAETRALAALLAVPEAGRSGAPIRIAGLALETVRLYSGGRAGDGRSGRSAGLDRAGGSGPGWSAWLSRPGGFVAGWFGRFGGFGGSGSLGPDGPGAPDGAGGPDGPGGSGGAEASESGPSRRPGWSSRVTGLGVSRGTLRPTWPAAFRPRAPRW